MKMSEITFFLLFIKFCKDCMMRGRGRDKFCTLYINNIVLLIIKKKFLSISNLLKLLTLQSNAQFNRTQNHNLVHFCHEMNAIAQNTIFVLNTLKHIVVLG